MGIESQDFNERAIAFAEDRGQSGPQAEEEIVLKKFAKVNEVLTKHTKIEVDPPDWPHPGPNDPEPSVEKETWAQGWPGGCSI